MELWEMSVEERNAALCKKYEERNEEIYAKMNEAVKDAVTKQIERIIADYKKGKKEHVQKRELMLDGFLNALSYTSGITIYEIGHLKEYLRFRCEQM